MKAAIDSGYNDAHVLQTTSEFDAYRSTEEFKALIDACGKVPAELRVAPNDIACAEEKFVHEFGRDQSNFAITHSWIHSKSAPSSSEALNEKEASILESELALENTLQALESVQQQTTSKKEINNPTNDEWPHGLHCLLFKIHILHRFGDVYTLG